MGNRWGQAVKALIAIEASTAGLETWLGRRQAEATIVAVMGATGRGSLVAGGAFKTLGAAAGETWGWSCCAFTGPSVGAGLALAGVDLHFTPLACVSRQTLAIKGVGQRVAGSCACGVAGPVQALVHVPLTTQPNKAWRAGTMKASRL